MRPPPPQTVSEWADAERVLSAETSAEPGRWRTSRAEYLRGVMDAFSDPAVEVVTVMKASQTGWTETLGNVVGYFMARDPAPMMLIQPTVKMAEQWSKRRLDPMLKDTPAVRGKVRPAKSRDAGNTTLEKSYPGGDLAIVGANAPSDLASRPRRIVLADEVDRYPLSAGGEGDPLTLAAKRQTTFWNRKRGQGSTPVDAATSVIAREFEAGDRRRYLVACPRCGHEQALRFAQVTWTKAAGRHRPETARYACEACPARWSDVERWQAIGRGRWQAEAPFEGHASFHVPGLLSPWLTLEEIARDFLASKDWPAKLKVWTNTVLGEPWEETGETSDPEALAARAEPFGADAVPEGVRVVTFGADVQADRIEITFVGWGDDEEAWVLEHRILAGDPSKLAVWADLDAATKARFPTEDGRALRASAGCVDSGYLGAMVLGFCRPRAGRRIFATKGVANDRRGSRPIWSARRLRAPTRGEGVWPVGVDTAKEDLHGRLRLAPDPLEPTARAVHFSADLTADYYAQLTSEHAVLKTAPDGRSFRRWEVKRGQERNEALDCFVLALAALKALPVRLTGGLSGRARQPAEPEPGHAPPARVRGRPRRRDRVRARPGGPHARAGPAPEARPAPPALGALRPEAAPVIGRFLRRGGAASASGSAPAPAPAPGSGSGSAAARRRPVSRYMAHDLAGVLSQRRAPLRDVRVDVREAWSRSAALAWDFIANNGWIAGAADQAIADAVGVELKLNARPALEGLGYSPAEASAWCRTVETAFAAWANNAAECDLEGKASLAELLDGALRYFLAEGEAFGVLDYMGPERRARYGIEWGTKLRLARAAPLPVDAPARRGLAGRDPARRPRPARGLPLPAPGRPPRGRPGPAGACGPALARRARHGPRRGPQRHARHLAHGVRLHDRRAVGPAGQRHADHGAAADRLRRHDPQPRAHRRADPRAGIAHRHGRRARGDRRDRARPGGRLGPAPRGDPRGGTDHQRRHQPREPPRPPARSSRSTAPRPPAPTTCPSRATCAARSPAGWACSTRRSRSTTRARRTPRCGWRWPPSGPSPCAGARASPRPSRRPPTRSGSTRRSPPGACRSAAATPPSRPTARS